MNKELQIMLPELNTVQLNWLEAYINVQVALAEREQMIKDAELAGIELWATAQAMNTVTDQVTAVTLLS